MTNKEKFIILVNAALGDTPSIKQLNSNYEEIVNGLEKELEALEKLKDPFEEEIKGDYLRHSHWYWNVNLNELCCATTICKWDGTYEKALDQNTDIMHYQEVFHCGTGTKPVTLETYLKMEGTIFKIVEEKEKENVQICSESKKQ